MAKPWTTLLGGAVFGVALSISNAQAAPCEQVNGLVSELVEQGLVEFVPADTENIFSYDQYLTTGDGLLVGVLDSVPAYLFQGGDGLGYYLDPANCEGEPTTGDWTTEEIAGLSVNIYIPNVEPSVQPLVAGLRPLMINMHGCGQTHDAFRDNGRWEATAEAYNLVVALPNAPLENDLHCWDAFGDEQGPGLGDADKVAAVAEALRDRAELNIDPNQIYVSGFSSGGTQTMMAGCIRPDLFAGVGIASAPLIGTDYEGENGNEWLQTPTDHEEALTMCQAFAGENAAGHETQLASIIFGDDYVINREYFLLNAGTLASVYEANQDEGTTPIAGNTSDNDGVETSWSKNGVKRVSMIEVSGLGHNWSTGTGEITFTAGFSSVYVNYPAFLMDYFHTTNMRVEAVVNTAPEITLIGDAEMTVEQGSDFEDPGATAYDAEDGDLTDMIAVLGDVNTNIPDSYSVTYMVIDSGPDPLTSTADRTVIVEPASSPTPTVIPTPTGTPLPTPIVSPTPTATPSPTLTPTPTPTPTEVPTETPSPTPTPTETPSPTPTPTIIPTVMPSPTPTGTPIPTETPVPCDHITSINFLHKVLARAYSEGDFFRPDYFAVGSGEPLAGSTYGVSSLVSDDGGETWYISDCE